MYLNNGIICFLHPETVDVFAVLRQEKVPEIGEVVEINGKKYTVFKRVHFLGEPPFISVKPVDAERNLMDIESVKKRVTECEEKIGAILSSFDNETGCFVFGIALKTYPGSEFRMTKESRTVATMDVRISMGG